MIATPMGKCTAVLGFAGLLGTLLLLLLGLPATVVAQGSRATPTPATVTVTQPLTGFTGGLRMNPVTTATTTVSGALGTLRFSPNAEAGAGTFHLRVNGLPPAPAGQAYSLWLSAAPTATINLGTFAVSAGQVDFAGSTTQDLPALYPTASIRLAAAGAASEDSAPTGAAILTATLPTTLATALRPLPAAPQMQTNSPLGYSPPPKPRLLSPCNIPASCAMRSVPTIFQRRAPIQNILLTSSMAKMAFSIMTLIAMAGWKTPVMVLACASTWGGLPQPQRPSLIC